jgi:hypothetical protein
LKTIYDNGREFKKNFEPLIKDFDIKPVCTTVENPWANAPIECVHQVIHNILVTKQVEKLTFDYIDPWGRILNSIIWAIRASYHSTTQATPTQAVFGRDMLFNISKVVDWSIIAARKREQIKKDNKRENAMRIDYDYSIGDRVYHIKQGVKRKLSEKKTGPYEITRTFTNVRVKLAKGAKRMRLNIRNIEPIRT